MINMVDVGYTGEINPSWKRHIDKIDHLLSFNPLIKSFSSTQHCHLQLAITDEPNARPKDFNVYHKKACSSLFKVDKNILAIRPGDPDDMKLDRVIKVGCSRLDELLDTIDVKFNYLRIDTQGSDFAVIKSLGKYLEDMWAIETEFFFERFYEGAPMGDVIYDYLEEAGCFKLVGNLRKPNNLFGDFLFINTNAPKEFLNFMERLYKCKVSSV